MAHTWPRADARSSPGPSRSPGSRTPRCSRRCARSCSRRWPRCPGPPPGRCRRTRDAGGDRRAAGSARASRSGSASWCHASSRSSSGSSSAQNRPSPRCKTKSQLFSGTFFGATSPAKSTMRFAVAPCFPRACLRGVRRRDRVPRRIRDSYVPGCRLVPSPFSTFLLATYFFLRIIL